MQLLPVAGIWIGLPSFIERVVSSTYMNDANSFAEVLLSLASTNNISTYIHESRKTQLQRYEAKDHLTCHLGIKSTIFNNIANKIFGRHL